MAWQYSGGVVPAVPEDLDLETEARRTELRCSIPHPACGKRVDVKLEAGEVGIVTGHWTRTIRAAAA
jgi:hypothetical protein